MPLRSMKCHVCKGDGKVIVITDEQFGQFLYLTCKRCKGCGVIDCEEGDMIDYEEFKERIVFMEPTGMKELHSVRFDEEIWDFIEKSHEVLGYRSRSEMINELLREVINEIDAEKSQGSGTV